MAGDEVPQPTDETLTATGYYRLGIWDDEPADPLQAEFDGFDDIVTTTGQAVFGLTINCARCHGPQDRSNLPERLLPVGRFLPRYQTPYGDRGGGTANSQIEVTPPELVEQYNHWTTLIRTLEEQSKELEQRGIVKMPAPDQRATEGPQRAKKSSRRKLRDHLSSEEFRLWQQKREALKLARRFLQSYLSVPKIMGLAKCQPTPQLPTS